MTPPMAEAFPVGGFLADELEARGWTQSEFADILGRPTQFVSEIISGKKEITRDSARQIAAAFDQSPEMWLKMQDAYYLWRQGQDRRSEDQLDDVRIRAKLSNLVPIGILRQRGIIQSDTPKGQAREVRELYKIKTLDELPDVLIATRRSNPDDDISAMQMAWVACARQKAEASRVASYDPAKLQALAEQLTRIVLTPEDFVRLPSLFAEAGVHLVFVEAFPGSKMDGCSFLLDDGSPAIAISGRGKRFDKVLFTILHEVAHVLLGHLNADKKYIIDDLSIKPTLGLEEPADQEAAKWAIPTSLPKLPERITSDWVNRTAAEQGVHPMIVIGRLQWAREIPWRTTLVRDAPAVTDYLMQW